MNLLLAAIGAGAYYSQRKGHDEPARSEGTSRE
jgi:hypothetical protein